MSRDAIASEGVVMLGSRLKRLAERLQASAEELALESGISAQPSQMPVLVALFRGGPASVGEIASRLGISQPSVTRLVNNLTSNGLVAVIPDQDDRRLKRLRLTQAGERMMELAQSKLWPDVETAVRQLCDCDVLLREVEAIEQRLKQAPLRERTASGLSVIDFRDELAPAFRELNEQWIRAMFSLEPADVEMLASPREKIIDPGGDILFVALRGAGVVGTCALRRAGPGSFELTKMCVSPEAQGRKAGEFLLGATILRALQRGAKSLYLLTNSNCAAAIHLYEKAGFVHDPKIMQDYGRRYDRCDVAMSFPIA